MGKVFKSNTWLLILDPEVQVLDYNVLSIWVKYQESSIVFENLAYLQSIENKCK